MNEQHITESFLNYLEGKGLNENSLSLQLLPELFLNYYKEIKFGEVDRQSDGDILLFQYGIRDWGKGKYFEIDFTRQFCEGFEDDSHQIYQLGITFFYTPENYKDIVPYNKWSSECSNLTEFKKIIINSLAFKRALNEIPLKKKIEVSMV